MLMPFLPQMRRWVSLRSNRASPDENMMNTAHVNSNKKKKTDCETLSRLPSVSIFIYLSLNDSIRGLLTYWIYCFNYIVSFCGTVVLIRCKFRLIHKCCHSHFTFCLKKMSHWCWVRVSPHTAANITLKLISTPHRYPPPVQAWL